MDFNILQVLEGVGDRRPTYPCTHCRNNQNCTMYRWCHAWVEWFAHEWREIQKMFRKV